MKTKGLYFLAIAAIFFSQLLINSGCKKDNNQPSPPPPKDTSELPPLGLVQATESELLSVQKAESIDTSIVPFLKGAYTLPDTSWIDVPSPSHDKQVYKSCTSWTVGYGILSYYYKVYEGHKDYDGVNLNRVFSPSYIHNQLLNGGRDTGFIFPKVFGLVMNLGCCKASDMLLNASINVLPSTTAKENAAKYKITDYFEISNLDINLMKTYLAKGHPLGVSILIDSAFWIPPGSKFEIKDGRKIWKKYSNGYAGYHAMVVCGYDNTINAFKLLNSWGDAWGDHGYIWIDYDFFKQAVSCVGNQHLSEIYLCLIKRPVLSTNNVSEIKNTTAQCGGNITGDWGISVSQRGVCWSTASEPTIADNKTNDGIGKGIFPSSLTGLTPNTNYYVKAYAINATGISYGTEVTFTTSNLPSSLATVTTSTESNVSATGATLGGNVTNDGNAPISERGIVYATTHSPTTSDNKVAIGNGTGIFSTNITGLTPNTPYYVRAYAINSQGTAYGVEISFTTSSSSTFSIGQSYGGGVIFYIDNTGQHGLIAAATDQSNSIQWYNPDFRLTGATERAIGTGKTNTDKIVAALGNGNYAAKLCDQLSFGGYDDWFLPSRDELAALFSYTGTSSLNANDYYWSSTESGGTGFGSGAWSSSKSFGQYSQTGTAKVRAIRAF